MQNIERRTYNLAEVRVEGDGDESPRIVGHAAVFDQLSEDLGGFREKVSPGAFSKTIGGDVRALFNHDPNMILGRTKSKTLRLSEDQHGLAVEIDPPDTETARHVTEAMRRGDVSQMSFGFRTISDIWEDTDGVITRTLMDVELFDVSPVVYPSYPQTDVAVRSLEEWRALNKPETEEAETITVGVSNINLLRAKASMALI